MACVYLIQNRINGKLYIGKTSQSPNIRWREHKKRARNQSRRYPLYLAMKKYGIDNFEFEIIELCQTEIKASVREKFYIELLNTKFPVGYNLTDGGEGILGFRHSNETKEVIRQKSILQFQKMPNPFLGKTHSEETRKLMSEKAKLNKLGSKNGMFGKHHSEETRRKISETKRKKLEMGR